MEDPTYTPEFIHPTVDATEPDGSIITICDWVIPEFINAPFLPSPTQTEDVASPDMSTDTLKRKHHVPRGERQAILSRRNQQFEASISRKVGTSIEDTSGDAGEGDGWTQRHTTMKITNNGNYYLILNGSCKTSIVCCLTKHVLTSYLNDLGDDNEGVIRR
jgi:hypothetical protein